jgi:hypothetical protein
MLTDAELTDLERRMAVSEWKCPEEAYPVIQELRRMRTTLRTISGLEILIRPGIDTMEVHKRLADAVILARAALGLPRNGEPTTLAPTSGSGADNAAQVAAKRTEPAIPLAKTTPGIPSPVPASESA